MDYSHVVIKFGDFMTQFGFGGEHYPRAIMPSITGISKYSAKMVGISLKKRYVGDEAFSRGPQTQVRQVFSRGKISSRDDLELCFYQIAYNELRVIPSENIFTILYQSLQPKTKNEMIMELLFGKLEVGCIKFIEEGSSVMTCCSTRSIPGVVVGCGEGVSSVSCFRNPIDEIKKCRVRQHFGGSDLSSMLFKKMKESQSHSLLDLGLTLTSYDFLSVVSELKSHFGVISKKSERSFNHATTTSSIPVFNHLNERLISFLPEYKTIPDALFTPGEFGFGDDILGIHELVEKSIMKERNEKMRKELCKNIILEGGCTLIKGFKDRLVEELQNSKVLPTKEIKVIDHRPEKTKCSAWIGASLIVKKDENLNFIKKVRVEEYDEHGLSILKRKGIF